ncbi:MAG: hypothetical protein Q7S28_02150 [bacterium]|nr:hypothetical protein [bacterium]
MNGRYITVDGEKIEIRTLGEGSGNAHLYQTSNGNEIRGIFAIVQYLRYGQPFEKVAYNVKATGVAEARLEIQEWMPQLQSPSFNESSTLLGIVLCMRKERMVWVS